MLVADDDVALRALVRVTLTAQGWTVLEAATPAECLLLARRHRPEVALLDVNFEGHARDGYSLCRELKTAADTAGIRVVLFTARNDPESRAFAGAVGATAFVVKPFGPLDLVRMLRLVREQPAGDPGIGLYLIEAGLLEPEQLERAVAEQGLRQGDRVPLGEILVERGFVSADDLRVALERQRRTRPLKGARPRSQVTLRVVVADDNESVRAGLRELIASQEDLVLVGAAADGAEALRIIRESRPDLVVLDNDMPRLSGLDVLKAVRASLLETAVVMFTLDDSVRDAALEAGAAAVVTKDTPLDTLLAELRSAVRQPVEVDGPSPVVLTSRSASRVAWGALERRRRAVAAVGILLVAYAGGFLISEPVLGASAAVFAIVPAAVAGALFGPEVGVATAVLSSVESAVLWLSTDHVVGEPVMRIGGNGLGILALLGIGAGFGGMRLLRGRLDSRARRVGALAEAALALSSGLGPATLGLLAEAALEVVPGESALLYVAVPGGGLELVAAAGASQKLIGTRKVLGAIAIAAEEGRASIVSDLQLAPIGVTVPHARSGMVVPLAGRGEMPGGVLAVLAGRRGAYSAGQLQALASFASFVASVMNAPEAAAVFRDSAAGMP
ncbi:MAG TPA: response regulator [Candidatus Limnocylindria bacterium]|nr:response regulator [Candidatus Limnocylindria bacterium]